MNKYIKLMIEEELLNKFNLEVCSYEDKGDMTYIYTHELFEPLYVIVSHNSLIINNRKNEYYLSINLLTN